MKTVRTVTNLFAFCVILAMIIPIAFVLAGLLVLLLALLIL